MVAAHPEGENRCMSGPNYCMRCKLAWCMGVSTQDGQTELTRIWCGILSNANNFELSGMPFARKVTFTGRYRDSNNVMLGTLITHKPGSWNMATDSCKCDNGTTPKAV
jgi:hypothetical protein